MYKEERKGIVEYLRNDKRIIWDNHLSKQKTRIFTKVLIGTHSMNKIKNGDFLTTQKNN